MKLYLTANKELLERTAHEGFHVYWQQFQKDVAEPPWYPEGSVNTHTLHEILWPPEDDESCLEFAIELTPQQIEMYYERGSDPRCREFQIPYELLVHAPIRLLTEAEIIAGIRAFLDVPDPRDGHTYRETLLKDVAAGKSTRYERAALEQDDHLTFAV